MIPLTAIPWRLIGYGVAVAAVLLLGWRVSVWHASHKALPAVQASLDLEVSCGSGSQCEARQKELQAAAEAKSAEVVSEYQRELEVLRNRPIPRRVIRVCNDRGVQSPGPAGAADGASPGTGELHGSTEFDLGPLRELAREADEQVALRRALMEWNRALSAQ